MSVDKSLLAHYRQDPTFRTVMKQLGANRPVVPEWKPQETRDASEKLIEEIKHASAQRQGFDLLYALILGEKPNG